MKNNEKVFMFLIGLLLGAVIATGAFLLYSKSCDNKMPDQMFGDNPPRMTDGQNNQRPDKPGMNNDHNFNNNRRMPDDEKTESSNN